MFASNHLRRVLYAAGGVAAVITLALAARLATERTGGGAGVAVMAVVFVSCWLIFGVLPSLRHRTPARHRGPGRDPETTPAVLAFAEANERLAA